MPKLQRAAVGGWALLDRRRVVMLITFVFAVAFSAARLQALGGGPASFVVAGDQFVRVAAAPAGLPVTHGPGYDGQFFYRLSMRPWTQQRTEFGITLDEPAYRHQRIVYPLVSFVVARGQPAATAWALLDCNLAGAAALGWLGAALARRRSRHALWGLALAAYPGFVLVIARDLADVVAAALLLAGLLALDHQRPLLAAASLTLAGLTRESTLILPLALAVVWAVAVLWPSSRVAVLAGRPASTASVASGRSRVWAVSFAVPLGVALAWQLVLWRSWGVAPLVQGSDRPGLPFAGSWQFTQDAFQFGAFPLVVRLAELVLVMAAALATAWSLPAPGRWRTRNSPGRWGWRWPCCCRGVSGSRTGRSCAPWSSRICWGPWCCWAGRIGVDCQSSLLAPSCACRSQPFMCAASNIVDRLVPDELGDLVRPLLPSPRPAHAVAFGVAP